MTNRPQILLQRLNEIGESLSRCEGALALLGLGSVGVEQARLDDYSDLDFFVIVAPGYKKKFLDDLSWLSESHPLAYTFRNTKDGYKALYEDGIFVENAIFEVSELESVSYAEGRLVWHVPGFDTSLRISRRLLHHQIWGTPAEYLVGEILTNLYVGLGRYFRGEKLSAQRFVQHYAVDRLMELFPEIVEAVPAPAFHDPFSRERRIEQRYPAFAAHLPSFVQGYHRTPESARAILAFLEDHVEVNPAMKAAILSLIEKHPS